MWYAGASQGNGAAYVLCFLLLSTMLVSLVHGSLNLRGLFVQTAVVEPAFAGDLQSVRVTIRNHGKRRRELVRVQVDSEAGSGPETPAGAIEPGSSCSVDAPLPTNRRGLHRITRVKLRSHYPLGLVEWHAVLTIDGQHIVYPAPRGSQPLPWTGAPADVTAWKTQLREGDDFTGVRAYLPGESQRHIDWKAVARGQPLMTKVFAGSGEGALLLRYDDVQSTNAEEKLSQLAQWLVEAERGGFRFGLEIPGKQVPLNYGRAHLHECLTALALWEGGTA
jgi:uncharacterized protein (DUF58 family)